MTTALPSRREETGDVFLPLTDPSCQDPLRAGGKAARLARARAAGLPVLPGLVVPVSASTDALGCALSYVDSLGRHGAQLQVMETPLPRLAELPAAAATLGDRLVVRSSSPLEGSSRWSGAFTSFLDVSPDAVLTAVRGVWASTLGRDSLERGEHTGLDPAAHGMAVLVQPQVQPEFGGTADVADDGEVTVVAVDGSPAELLGGWRTGVTARCAADGATAGAAKELLGAAVLDRVAELARCVRETCHDNLVEWACADGNVVLLQSTATRAGDNSGIPSRHAIETALPDNAAAVAQAVSRYAGATGEALVLPWLVAGATPDDRLPWGECDPPALPSGPLEAWQEAVLLSDRLIASVWCGADEDARHAGLAGLLTDDLERTLVTLAGLPSADRGTAARLGILLDHVATHLVRSRILESADEMWSLQSAEIESVLRGTRSAPASGVRRRRRAALRWEAFCYTATMSHGSRMTGDAASAGVGAGPVVYVGEGVPTAPLPPRAVVVAPRPLPHLAPLLWEASALVTFGGSPAAHLAEVARSLNVPAVVGCAAAERVLATTGARQLAAVDGSRGVVSIHPSPLP